MKNIKDFVKRHPVLTYYVLVFAISLGAILATIALTGMPTTKEQMAVILPVLIVNNLLGPSVSGLLMIGLLDGRAGFRDLRARLGRWRVSARWYVIALLLAPLLIMAVLMVLSLFSPVYLPGIFTRDDKMACLMMGLFSGIFVGICEELGWTGFVTPRLRQRYSVLSTGLIIGVLWGAWHILPMAILPSVAYSGSLSPIIYIIIRTISFLGGSLVAFRVLMLWVYDRTESLLMLILMHIGLTTVNIIYEPEAIGGISNFIYDFVGAAALWSVVILVALANRWHISLKVLPNQGARKLQYEI
ncbi:MAG: CPBP family intramembrane metalloprotease [Thermoplasmata archaeon]|nr:MAG: CPBP family intramembrane metalloprotease [Thermoplasmata archaeon]